MTITVVFDPPLPTDTPEVFNSKAFTLVGDLNTWSTEANAVQTDVNNNAIAADASADTAANQATIAGVHATTAFNAATSAQASFDSFDDRYLGAKTSDPTLDNDGNALLTGALYWNSSVGEMRAWNGSAWVATSVANAVSRGGDTMTGNLNVPSLNGGQLAGLRNRIINGNFDVWQRGTAFTTGAVYTADRWKTAGATGQTVNRIADHPSQGANGFCAEVVHTSGAQWLSQYVEALNSRDLVGKTVTVTAWVLRTSGSANQNLQLLYANTADNFSATTSIASSGGVAATVWTQLTLTTTIPAGGANGLEVRVVTGGSAATVRVAQVQLEVGSVATPFEHRPYGLELALCRRYYYREETGGVNSAPYGGHTQSLTTTSARLVIKFPVPMRIRPTALEQSGTAADWQIVHGGTTTALSAVPTYQNATVFAAAVDLTVASGLTVGQAGYLRSTSTNNTFLAWSAEL